MEVRTMANRVYTLDELKKCLAQYDREGLLIGLSRIHANLYQENVREYHNLSQVMPGICNAILMYAEGTNKIIPISVYDEINLIVASLELDELKLESPQDHIDKRMFRLGNGHEFLPYVHMRVWWMFDWIKSNYPNLEFSKVAGLKLEDIFFITFGACSIGLKGEIPAFVPSSFFKGTVLEEEEIAKIVKIFRTHFTIELNEAIRETLKAIPVSKTFNDVFTIFEEKPFLSLHQGDLLLLPHKITNDFMGAVSGLYVKSYSNNPSNPASDVLGKSFEEYVRWLVSKVMKDLDFEPKYKNDKNAKGIDILNLKKGGIPLFIEIAKQTMFKSLLKDFSTAKYEEFLIDRIIPKFHQTFSWLKSHEFQFNGVSVLHELTRSQFVLVIAEKLPLMNFDNSANALLSLINNCWEDATGLKGIFKRKNIYVLGVHEVERLVSVCIESKIHFSLMLFEYSRYVSKTREIAKVGEVIRVRQDFLSWLIEEYESKKNIKIHELGYKDHLLAATSKRFKETRVSDGVSS